MTNRRFKEIYEAVVINAFYDVGEDGNISHEEMVELLKYANKCRMEKQNVETT
jgi:Ca2+-binding EF-hand superfamily protein